MPIIKTYKILASTNQASHIPGRIIFMYDSIDDQNAGNGEVVFITNSGREKSEEYENFVAKYNNQTWNFSPVTKKEEEKAIYANNKDLLDKDKLKFKDDPLTKKEIMNMDSFIKFVVTHEANPDPSADKNDGPGPGSGTAGDSGN